MKICNMLNKEQIEIVKESVTGETDKGAALRQYVEGYKNASMQGPEYEELEEEIRQIAEVIEKVDNETLSTELEELLREDEN